jgi:MOSC domain-containing protein YiiM
MKLLSINVGLPREIEWRGRTIETSIYKAPVAGCVRVGKLNLEGDKQSDLSVHGGLEKAVYAYPVEHYTFWGEQFAGMDLAWGAFGENFTTEGLLENSVCIGDHFRVGSAEFVVTQPRMPCFKLAIRFGREDILENLLRSGRTGFYLAVIQEGEVTAGESFELISRSESSVSVADVIDLYTSDVVNNDLLRRAIQAPSLPESWREYFRNRLFE